jgi:EAL domain-containing protein (putative c-di-GMP-specific phosphodiesterase class I)
MEECTMISAGVQQFAFETELWRALARGTFELHYQPEVDLSTGTVTGMEALMRWPHPERGVVTPNDFLPVAEESGLMMALGRWALREACRQAAGWQTLRAGGPPISVSVNLSTRELRHEDLINHVSDVLEEFALTPRLLQLEIRDSKLGRGKSTARSQLQALKALGVRLTTDQFAAREISRAALSRLPFNSLKIDRGLLSQPLAVGEADPIARISDVGHAAGMRVIAQGIETAEQLARVIRAGCDCGQGFFFSAAVPPDAVPLMLESGRFEVLLAA